MKKTYRLQDLDCASCAAKMEAGISAIDGVSSVSVNFLTQRLTIETSEAQHGDIMKKAVKICRRIEPDCRIILD